jgi:glucosamine-phosphate N-acetyltransferase
MIETIKPNHNIEDYFECVEDLMNIGEKSSPQEFGDKLLSLQSNRYEVYVYLIDGKIVATAAILYEYKLRYKKPKAYIEDVAVHKQYRGRGLGKKMVEHCVKVAKEKNCYKIVLSCNDDLVDFYQGLSFEKDINFMVMK